MVRITKIYHSVFTKINQSLKSIFDLRNQSGCIRGQCYNSLKLDHFNDAGLKDRLSETSDE